MNPKHIIEKHKKKKENEDKIPKQWNLLPLPKNKKFPPPKEWEQTRFSRERIKSHDGNIALGTGDISGGVIVFDWDFRKGMKKKGFKVIFEEFKKAFPQLVDTRIVETPNGYHFYYILKGKQYKNTKQENLGYSKTLKTFTSTNETRFAKYLKGLDTRANQGYVVMPPSKVNGKKYKWLNNKSVKHITKEQYTQIFEFFEEPNPQKHTIRSKFVDILMGKIDVHTIKHKTGLDEHVYWKELFHELYACTGLEPHRFLKGLHKNQPSFDLDKAKTQLNNDKNLNYIKNGKRMTSAKYKQYFRISDLEEEYQAPFREIPHGDKHIRIYDNHIDLVTHYKNRPPKIEKVLGCGIKLLRKCIYHKEELYTYKLKNYYFYTDSILEILRNAEPYLRKGMRGRDCLKEVIDYYGKQLKPTKAKEFIGFDNGWNLPHLEKEQDFSIVTVTDIQSEAYERSKRMIKSYTREKKDEIRKDLEEFIKRTQCEKENLAILIGWSLAAPFRLFFIRNYKLFPMLYNYGKPDTGRSTLEDFWIVNFYKIYKDHLSPGATIPQIQDHLSESTFPQSFQDIGGSEIRDELISLLKDYSTGITKYEKKKNARERDFLKYLIAGLNLDSNYILDYFTLPAVNERQIFLQFMLKVTLDIKWLNLQSKLEKEKLFSFVFERTKEWKDKDVKERFIPILEEFSKFNVNASRLLKSGAMVKFGIDLFEEVFKIDLNITNKEIIDTIVSGSAHMSKTHVFEFRSFCSNAICYDETTETIKEYADGSVYPQINYGENPKYLNHRLRMDSKKEFYIYTTENHQDFKSRYKKRIGMEKLAEKVRKGLDVDEIDYVKYKRMRPFRDPNTGNKCKTMGVIRIKPEFFGGESKEKGVDASNLVLDSRDESTGKIDVDKIIAGGDGGLENDNTLEDALNQIKEMHEYNDGKPLYKDGVRQSLELEDYEDTVIEEAIEHIIEDQAKRGTVIIRVGGE
ncbi:MAG: bifunctional DNA primase/polymerase [Candidatus Cloacimonetes bacterium]|nr:bifunctional DNA primase/polymerase [Candidatus Cloacimonadota bacterium]